MIYCEDRKEYVARYFPNSADASTDKIDSFRVSIDDLKQKLDYVPYFDIPDAKETVFRVEGNSRGCFARE